MNKGIVFLAGFAAGAVMMYIADRSVFKWQKKPLGEEPKSPVNVKDTDVDVPPTVEEVFPSPEMADTFYEEKLDTNTGNGKPDGPPIIVVTGESATQVIATNTNPGKEPEGPEA